MRPTVTKEKKKYLDGTAAILEVSQRTNKQRSVKVNDHEFVVLPNVFSPIHFADTEFFAQNIPFRAGEKFLEIGPGAGVTSVLAALAGATVTAVEINWSAVLNTRQNANRNGVTNQVNVLHGDIYEPLPKDGVFDTIFWNTPFGYVERDDLSVLEQAVFDSRYEATERFIRGSRQHIAPGGRLLIGFSSTLGDMELLNRFLGESGYTVRLLAETKSTEVHPVKFELLEARVKETT